MKPHQVSSLDRTTQDPGRHDMEKRHKEHLIVDIRKEKKKKEKSELGDECHERTRKAWETPLCSTNPHANTCDLPTLLKCQEINFCLFNEPSEMTLS